MSTSGGGEQRPNDALAPVTPLFGSRTDSASPSPADRGRRSTAARTHTVRFREEPPAASRAPRAAAPADATASAERDTALDAAATVQAAESTLLRKLRTRQLSVSEARRVLREHDVDEAASEEIVERMIRHGYLDDARLAEQLSYAAVTRKGQGRRAIAQALTARGIARDAADAAVAELPDDDDERALEVARARAHRVGADRDAALRRLVGQLTRRGFSSSVAMTAARTALDERR